MLKVIIPNGSPNADTQLSIGRAMLNGEITIRIFHSDDSGVEICVSKKDVTDALKALM